MKLVVNFDEQSNKNKNKKKKKKKKKTGGTRGIPKSFPIVGLMAPKSLNKQINI